VRYTAEEMQLEPGRLSRACMCSAAEGVRCPNARMQLAPRPPWGITRRRYGAYLLIRWLANYLRACSFLPLPSTNPPDINLQVALCPRPRPPVSPPPDGQQARVTSFL
jgi:hypothetical protein